jgi:acetyl esterase/lipase
MPLGIDPEHIGAHGTSAGGNIAALLGTADASAGFDVGEYLDQSSRVQAVVVMREIAVVGGVYGAQLPDIDDSRAEAVRRITTST